MRIKSGLTRLFIRILRQGKFTHLKSITLADGRIWDVYVFSGRERSIPGQVTPWGTIVIHEYLLTDISLLNLVLLHESRHARRWFEWWIIIFLAIVVVVFYTRSDYVLAVLAFLGFMLYSWYVEFDAEFYTINNLGLPGYKNITDQFERKSNIKLIRRVLFNVWIFFTHPPRQFVIPLYQLTHRKVRNEKGL